MNFQKIIFFFFVTIFFAVGSLFIYSSFSTEKYSVDVFLSKNADPFSVLPEIGVGDITIIKKIEDSPNAYEIRVRSKETPENLLMKIKNNHFVDKVRFHR